ncbi:MAG: RHS repeat protein, partial [Candidatus Abyssobacteria bacterium SURF_17]
MPQVSVEPSVDIAFSLPRETGAIGSSFLEIAQRYNMVGPDGDLRISIPLFEVPGKLPVPLDLTYKSGIKLDQEASWVGLGWNLAGWSVKRVTVHGDDVQSFTYYDKDNQSRFFVNDMYQVDIPGRSIRFFNKGTVEQPQFVPIEHSLDSLYVCASTERLLVCDSTCVEWWGYIPGPPVSGYGAYLCECPSDSVLLPDLFNFQWDPKWVYTEYEYFVLVDEDATRYVFKMPLRRTTVPGPAADFYRKGGQVNTCEWNSRNRAANSEWMLTAILSHDYVDGGGDPLDPLDCEHPRVDNHGSWVAFNYKGHASHDWNDSENTEKSRHMGLWTISDEIVRDRDTTEITYLRRIVTPNVVVDFTLQPIANFFRNIRFWRSGHGPSSDTSRVKDLLLTQLRVFEYSGSATQPGGMDPFGICGEALYQVSFNYDFPDSVLLKTQLHRCFCGGGFDPLDRTNRDGEATLRSITVGTDNRPWGAITGNWPRHAREHQPWGFKKRFAFEYDQVLENSQGLPLCECQDPSDTLIGGFNNYTHWVMGKDWDNHDHLNYHLTPWSANSLVSQQWLQSVTRLIPEAWTFRDFFGYHYQHPQAWSLTKVTIPEGATFEYHYEPDEYMLGGSHWISGGCRVKSIVFNAYSGITEYVYGLPAYRWFQEYPYKDVEAADSIVFTYGENDDGIGYATSMPSNYELFRTRYSQQSMMPWHESLTPGWYLRFLGDNAEHSIQYPRVVWHLPQDRGTVEHYYLTTDTMPPDKRVTMLFRVDSTAYLWNNYGKNIRYFNAYWIDRSPLHGVPYKTIMRNRDGLEVYYRETVYEWPVVNTSIMPSDDGFESSRFCFIDGPDRFDCDTIGISYHVRPTAEIVREDGVQTVTQFDYEDNPLGRLRQTSRRVHGHDITTSFEYAALGDSGQANVFDNRHYLALMTAITESEEPGGKRSEQRFGYRSDFNSQSRSGEQAIFYLSETRQWINFLGAPNDFLTNTILDVDQAGNPRASLDSKGIVTSHKYSQRGLEVLCRGEGAEMFTAWSENPEDISERSPGLLTQPLYIGPTAAVVSGPAPAFTGVHSVFVPPSSPGPALGIGAYWDVGEIAEDTYIAECWAMPSSDSAEATLKMTSSSIVDSIRETGSHDWTHLVCSLSVPPNGSLLVEVSARGGGVYVDDFRVYPAQCEVATAAYDPLGRQTSVSEDNGVPVRRFYDQYGDLTATADHSFHPVEGEERFFRSTDATDLTLYSPSWYPPGGGRYRSDAPNLVYRIQAKGGGHVDDFSVSQLHRYEADDSLILNYGRLWFQGDKDNPGKEAHLKVPVEPFRSGIMFFETLDSMSIYDCPEYFTASEPIEEQATLWYGIETENGHGYFTCITETGKFRVYKYQYPNYATRTLIYEKDLSTKFIPYYARRDKGKQRLGFGRFGDDLYFFINNHCVYRLTETSFTGEEFSYLRFKFNNSRVPHCKQRTWFDNLIFYADPVITTDFIDGAGMVKQRQVFDGGRVVVSGATHTLDFLPQTTFLPVALTVSETYGDFGMINDQINPFNFIGRYLGADSMFYWSPGQPLDSASYLHYYYVDTPFTADCELDGLQRPYSHYEFADDPKARPRHTLYAGEFANHPTSTEWLQSPTPIRGYTGSAFDADSLHEEVTVDENNHSTYTYRDKLGRAIGVSTSTPAWRDYSCVGMAVPESLFIRASGSSVGGPYFQAENLRVPGTLEPPVQSAELFVEFYDDFGCSAEVNCRVYKNSQLLESCTNASCSGYGSFCVKAVELTPGDLVRVEVRYPEWRGPSGYARAVLRYTVCDDPSIDTAGIATLFYRDFYGNDTLIVQPDGQSTRRTFTNLGWLYTETSPDAGFSHYCYDQLGNLRFAATASDEAYGEFGRFRYYKYDSRERLVEEGVVLDNRTAAHWGNAFNPDWPNPTILDTATYRVTARYEYDLGPFGRGHLTRATRYYSGHSDSASWEAFSYDARGRLVEKRVHVYGLDDSLGVETFNTYHLEYDNLNQTTRITYPNGKFVDFEYDLTGNVSSLNDDEGLVRAEFDYWPNGKVRTKRLGLPAVQVVNYRYNARDWLTDINNIVDVHYEPTGPETHYALSLNYTSGGFGGTWDGPQYPQGYFNGNVSGYRLAVSPGQIGDFLAQSFAYDELDRLIGEVSEMSGQLADTTLFGYDRNGNILTVTDGNLLDHQPTLEYAYYAGTNRLRCLSTTGSFTDNLLYTPSGSLSRYVSDDMTMKYNHYEQLAGRAMEGDLARDSAAYWYNTLGKRIAKRFDYTYMGWCPADTTGIDPELPLLLGG